MSELILSKVTKEDWKTKLNQKLLRDFGMNISISEMKNIKPNTLKVGLSYSRLFSFDDEIKKTIYIRCIYFGNIYSFDYNVNEPFNIDRDILDSSIKSEYNRILNELSSLVLTNKNIVLKLIKNVHTVTHFLSKFVYLLTKLSTNDKIMKSELEELIMKSPKYSKYIQILTEMGFAEYNKEGDLITTQKTRVIIKNNKDKKNVCKDDIMKESVDEILYLIVKDNLDYIAHILRLAMVKPLIDVITCLLFYTKRLNFQSDRISFDRFYRTHHNLIGGISEERLENYLLKLSYASIINLEKGTKDIILTPLYSQI